MEREIPEEFDSDFLINNPAVVLSQKLYVNNDCPPNVSLPNNNT